MVNKLIISKSIDDAIIKCSQGFRLNKKVLKTFNKFHDETCGEKFRKTEKAIVTDNMGNIVYQKNGGKHSAEFIKEIIGLINDNAYISGGNDKYFKIYSNEFFEDKKVKAQCYPVYNICHIT